MFARLRSILFAINASYWFFPAVFAVGGLLLGLLMVHLDHTGLAETLNKVTWLSPARPSGASNMLQVLAGSMIGVASTVFSITIAAVAYASGNYGPRLLTNFMEDRGNQLSLATFIGTFVYAITVLRSVRAEDESSPFLLDSTVAPGFVPQLSLLVAFVLMLVAVGVLVYFLHHVPSSIRINTVLEKIGDRLLAEIRHRYPREGDRDPPHRAMPRGACAEAHHRGYVRYVDYDALVAITRKDGLWIGLTVRPGDFVYPGVPIASTDRDSVPEDLASRIRACVALGASRTPEQDIEFSLDELVEIALRALSPGINDPFTAITALHWLGAATASLGRRDLDRREWADGADECLLFTLHDDFEHFVMRGFAAARSAVATSRLATLEAFDSIALAASHVHGERRTRLLVNEIRLLAEQARIHLEGPDLADIEQRLFATLANLEQ
jgi:uncharacterized membrane protein